MWKNNFFFLFFLFFFVGKTFAFSVDDIQLSFGPLTNHVNKVQIDDGGNKRKFEFSPFFYTSTSWFIFDSISLSPELGLGIPEKGVDKNINRFHYQILGNVSYHYKRLITSLGAGLAFTRISSKGGEVLLDNGLGQTSFPLPEYASTSRNFILSLGLDFLTYDSFSIAGRMLSYNITNKQRKSWSYFFGINYHFGEQNWSF